MFTCDEAVEKPNNSKNDEELKCKQSIGLFHVPEGLNQKTLGQTLMRPGRSMAGFPSSDGFKITSDKNKCHDWMFGEADDKGWD